MLDNEKIMEVVYKKCPFQPSNHYIHMLAYAGSISHGTVDPETGIDDVDITGIIIPPVTHYLGLTNFEQWNPEIGGIEGMPNLDLTMFDLRKVVRLWMKSNPNVAPLLWVPEKHILYVSPSIKMFRDNRNLFDSMSGYRALRGYAMSQMKDIDKAVYRGYMGAKRKALVALHGYDPKHAAHTIRLLRMGIEYLQTGAYFVDRTGIDALELVDIKKGRWNRDRIMRVANELVSLLDAEASKKPFPEVVNSKAIEELLICVMLDHTEAEQSMVRM